jgi:hypothetical protein
MFITITLMIHSHPYGFVMVCPKTGNRNQKSNCFGTEKKLSLSVVQGTTQIFHGRAVTCAQPFTCKVTALFFQLA